MCYVSFTSFLLPFLTPTCFGFYHILFPQCFMQLHNLFPSSAVPPISFLLLYFIFFSGAYIFHGAKLIQDNGRDVIGDQVMLEAVYGCLQLILFVGNGRQRNAIRCTSQKRKQTIFQGRNEAVNRAGIFSCASNSSAESQLIYPLSPTSRNLLNALSVIQRLPHPKIRLLYFLLLRLFSMFCYCHVFLVQDISYYDNLNCNLTKNINKKYVHYTVTVLYSLPSKYFTGRRI